MPIPYCVLYCTVKATHTAPEQLASDEVAFVMAVPFVEYAEINTE